MKCPKCGYISFDYNQVCPKCDKDIANEQSKLNLPSFRPNPPSLLGILTGEADESNVGLHTDSSASMRDSHEMDVRLDDSTVIGTSEIDLDEGHDMEDISLGHEDSGDFELSGEEEISLADVNEIPMKTPKGLLYLQMKRKGERYPWTSVMYPLKKMNLREFLFPKKSWVKGENRKSILMNCLWSIPISRKR